MIRINEKIPLKLQLFDGAIDKYPLAYVYDDSMNEITGSPFSLNHIFHGLYASNAASMPDTSYVIVQYRVYDDILHQSKSLYHADALDIFFKEEANNEVMTKLNEIISLLQSMVVGTVASKNIIQGNIINGKLISKIDKKNITSKISSIKLTGEIKDDKIKKDLRLIKVNYGM